MALLSPEEWKAEWIGPTKPPSEEPELGKWIWHPDFRGANTTSELRKHFELPAEAAIQSAWLYLRVDNNAKVWLNGQRVAQWDDFHTTGGFDVTERVRAGANLLAMQATNEDGPCGLHRDPCHRMRRRQPAGADLMPPGRPIPGSSSEWQQPGLDDSAWPAAAIIAEFGEGPWGGPDGSPQQRSICLRKDFLVKPALKRARLYVTGLGIYEASLNGQRVGEDYFSPGWTAYSKRVQYKTYDVTGLLKEGPNALGAILGNGWWSGGMGWASSFAYPGASMRLLAQLELNLPGWHKRGCSYRSLLELGRVASP